MKLGIIADVHAANHRRFGGASRAGVNTRCQQIINTLYGVREACLKRQVERLVIAGDLFDTTRPEPQIVAEVQRAIEQDEDALAVTVLSGNHDRVSDAAGDHALGPLVPVCQVVDTPTIQRDPDVDLWLVPVLQGVAAESLPLALSRLAEEQGQTPTGPQPPPRVLALHLGLIDGETPPWLRDSGSALPVETVARLAKQYGIAAVFAGDWHETNSWSVDGVELVQVGAMCPTGFDNPGLGEYGSLWVWDSKTGKMERVVIPGPRFVRVGVGDHIPVARVRKASQGGSSVYVSVTVMPDAYDKAKETAQSCKNEGIVEDYEVLLDSSDAEIQARTAAQAARSASTLGEALAGFVGEMQLPDGITREEVMERAAEYLR